MLFSKLMEAELPVELSDEVNRLLDLKMNYPELKLIPRNPEINDYVEEGISSIKNEVKLVDDHHEVNMDELNQLFLHELKN